MITTQEEMVRVLSAVRGATPITFVARTDTKALKTGNPYGKIYKTSRVNGMVCFKYPEGVIRRLEKEGKSPDEFLQGESWHEAVLTTDGKLTPFCRHKTNGSVYIRFMFLNRYEVIYRSETGQVLTEEQVRPFLPKKSGYANQGLDEPLRFVTYKLSGISEMTVGEETLIIEENQPS